MFVVSNFVGAIALILNTVLTIYMYVIIASALLSWVNPDPNNPIVRFLRTATEPVLRPIRKAMGLRMSIDFSPIIALLAIMFLQHFLVRSLEELSRRMG